MRVGRNVSVVKRKVRNVGGREVEEVGNAWSEKGGKVSLVGLGFKERLRLN